MSVDDYSDDVYKYIQKLRLKDPSITDAEAEEMYENSMSAKKKDTKVKKDTRVASLRSSKDKKFIGHTGRA